MRRLASAQSKFSARVRFNWGFHDATRDNEAGQPRALLMGGPQSPAVVSYTYDADYYRGYSKGLEHGRAAGNTRPASSQPAWDELKAAGVYSAKDERESK